MPAVCDLSVVENTATLPQMHGNSNAPPNEVVPPGGDGYSTPDPAPGSEIFRELWAINGPFDEPWMSAFNAEVWGYGPVWPQVIRRA